MGTIGYGFETQEHRETDGAGESGGDGGEGERDHGAFSLDGKGGRTRPLREREGNVCEIVIGGPTEGMGHTDRGHTRERDYDMN
jgi:hypothetical protein